MAINQTEYSINKFSGLFNKARGDRAPDGSQLVADNVFIDDGGGIRQRPGKTTIQALSDIRSCYSTDNQKQSYMVAGSSIFRLVNDQFVAIYTDNDLIDSDCKWAEFGDTVYAANEKITLVISNDSVRKSGIPAASFVAQGGAGGSLHKGEYHVIVTHVDDITGQEGGATSHQVVTVEDNGLIVVSVNPMAGYHASIYVTGVNGLIYYRQSAPFITHVDESFAMDSELYGAESIDSGINELAVFDGRLFASKYIRQGDFSRILFSKAMRHELFELTFDYIDIEGQVRMMAPTDQGLIIGTDSRIMVLTPERTLQRLADYGVPLGHQHKLDRRNGHQLFASNRGICKGLPFENLTDEFVSLPKAVYCTTAITDIDGSEQFVVVVLNEQEFYNKFNKELWS